MRLLSGIAGTCAYSSSFSGWGQTSLEVRWVSAKSRGVKCNGQKLAGRDADKNGGTVFVVDSE